MKDIVITSKSIRRELYILLGCFIFAVLFDAFGVIKYGKPFYEIFQTIGYEIVITVILYCALAFFRIIVHAIMHLFRK